VTVAAEEPIVPAGDLPGASDAGPVVDEAEQGRTVPLPDFALAIGLLAIVGVVVWSVWGMSLWNGTTPGPAFLPVFVAGLLIVCGAWIAVRRAPAARVRVAELRAAGIFLGLLVVSASAFMWLGAYITVGLFVIAELKLLHRRRWRFALGAGVGIAAGVWLVFSVLLQVRLPLGILTPLFQR